MKKYIFILMLCLPAFMYAQSSRDINEIIQKTLDLHALKVHYTVEEQEGITPLIIINDDRIPNNLIVFKFNKRVKVMSFEELEKFKSLYKGNLDSYFVFEVIEFKGEKEVAIKVKFRKTDSIEISIHMKKEGDKWMILDSAAK